VHLVIQKRQQPTTLCVEIVKDTSASLLDLLDEGRIDVAMSQQREAAAGRGGALMPALASPRSSARRFLGAGHGGGAFLIDLTQCAALSGAGSLLRRRDLLAGTFQARRELGTRLTKLPFERLELAYSPLVTRLRGSLGLALGLKLALQRSACSLGGVELGLYGGLAFSCSATTTSIARGSGVELSTRGSSHEPGSCKGIEAPALPTGLEADLRALVGHLSAEPVSSRRNDDRAR